MLLGIVYHYVQAHYDYPYVGRVGLTAQQFENQVVALKRLGDILSLANLRSLVSGDDGGNDLRILLTFDDGLRDQYEIALPILSKHGVPAAFFVNTAPIAEGVVLDVHKTHHILENFPPDDIWRVLRSICAGRGMEDCTVFDDADVGQVYRWGDVGTNRIKYLVNHRILFSERRAIVGQLFAELVDQDESDVSADIYMTRDQLKDLADRGYLGSHGHGHINLGLESPANAADDVRKAHELLRQWTGTAMREFCYPYGTVDSCPRSIAELLKRLGYEFAFTIEPGINRDMKRPFYLGRLDCNDVPGGKTQISDGEGIFAAAGSCSWDQ